MVMTWIDWTIVAVAMVIVLSMAMATKKYMRSVADFLAAGRCGGRYLLTISEDMAAFAAIAVIALFELHYKSGFPHLFWWLSFYPIKLILHGLGYVIYRYRESRAMTMGQFFEMRYSKRFRIFTGILAWAGGTINFGIFPAVGSRFFIYYCGMPHSFMFLGIEWSTFAVLMFILIVVALFFTFIGGQVAVMITDFVQAGLTNIGVIIIIAFFLIKFDWGMITEVMINKEPGHSLVNPLDNQQVEGFGFWYFMILYFTTCFYNCNGLAWGGGTGYHCSAKSAHEFKMARVLSILRSNYMFLVVLVLAVGSYVVMNHPECIRTAEAVNATLDSHNPSETIREQMLVPVVLSQVLPAGLIGIFCTVMLAAFISTHDTALHMWGSIFVQDVILPFRKRPFDPKTHMWLLRLSVCFVAAFSYCFSLFFKQTEYIFMFMQITGSIYIAGIGSVILGGLYWKRGTTAAAWTAMIWGATASVTTLILQQIWKYALDSEFPINGFYMGFFIAIGAIILYVLVSLLGKKTIFDLNRVFHRGQYARKDQKDVLADAKGLAAFGIRKGLPLGDKITFLVVALWAFGGLAVFLYFLIYELTVGMSDQGWSIFWKYYVYTCYAMLIIVSVWFLAGGIKNVKEMFADLAVAVRNDLDSGMVVDHHSLEDEAVGEQTPELDSQDQPSE